MKNYVNVTVPVHHIGETGTLVGVQTRFRHDGKDVWVEVEKYRKQDIGYESIPLSDMIDSFNAAYEQLEDPKFNIDEGISDHPVFTVTGWTKELTKAHTQAISKIDWDKLVAVAHRQAEYSRKTTASLNSSRL